MKTMKMSLLPFAAMLFLTSARAEVIYNNLGPGGTFQGGLALAINPLAVANPFTSAATIRFSGAKLGMSTAGGTTANVYLATSNGSLPGVIIDTLVQDGLIRYCQVNPFQVLMWTVVSL